MESVPIFLEGKLIYLEIWKILLRCACGKIISVFTPLTYKKRLFNRNLFFFRIYQFSADFNGFM